jgi:hypothetical protein
MKTYLGNGGIAPRILDLGSRWRWVISFTPRPLHSQGKSLRYPLHRSLGGPQSRSGSDGEEKNSQPPTGIETQELRCTAHSLVTIPTELSRQCGPKWLKITSDGDLLHLRCWCFHYWIVPSSCSNRMCYGLWTWQWMESGDAFVTWRWLISVGFWR